MGAVPDCHGNEISTPPSPTFIRLQQIVQIVIMRSSNDQTTKTDEISFLCRGNGLSFGDKENSSDIQRDLLRLPVSREPSIGGRWVYPNMR